MDAIPKRVSLVAQTTTILRDSLQAGIWKDFLPGEHDLCARFHVSRPTVRSALLQLEHEGWLKRQPGQRRALVANRVNPGLAPLNRQVVLLSPLALPQISANALLWVDALRDQVGAAGYRLEFHTTQASAVQHPALRLESLARRLRPAAWVLYQSSAEVQAWFSERGLPAIIAGSRHPRVDLSSVDIDYAATCSHAVGLLAGKGRRRIALLMPRSGCAGDLDSEAGFITAAQKFQGDGMQASVTYHDDSAADICRTLDLLRRGDSPRTGLLVAKPLNVITAVSHLLRCAVKFPQDLSLISRDDDPAVERLVPAVTRYHTDPSKFARKVSRLVLDLLPGGARHHHDSRLMPTLVRGETLA